MILETLNIQPIEKQRLLDALPQAAVMVLLTSKDDPHLVMVEKAGHLRRHAGEIAFPGGKLEPGEDHLQTAYRECYEEIGVSKKDIRLLGQLGPQITRHRMAVYPYVGLLEGSLEYRLDQSEIASVFEMPVAHVLERDNHRTREAMIDGEPRKLSYFDYKDYHVWGVTALIIRELIAYDDV